MNFKRATAALASALLISTSAFAEEPQAANPSDATGATGPGVVILELQGSQPGSPEATPEEMLAMQLLLLQLLMMQQEPGSGEVQAVPPGATQGTGI